MKKMLIAIIILLLIVIFLLLYCNCRKKCKEPGKPVSGFCKTGDCYTYNGETPAGMINYNLAKIMTEDYARDLGKKFVWEGDVRTDSPDSRCIWFNLNKMKQFIAYTEQSLCRIGCNDSTSLGIRFYYAKYPSVSNMDTYNDLREVPREYARRHTLFMVPTFWDPVKKKNVDFDPGQVQPNCKIIPLGSPGSPYPGRVWGAALMGADDGTGDAQNHGSLRPPPAGEYIFPQY